MRGLLHTIKRIGKGALGDLALQDLLQQVQAMPSGLARARAMDRWIGASQKMARPGARLRLLLRASGLVEVECEVHGQLPSMAPQLRLVLARHCLQQGSYDGALRLLWSARSQRHGPRLLAHALAGMARTRGLAWGRAQAELLKDPVLRAVVLYGLYLTFKDRPGAVTPTAAPKDRPRASAGSGLPRPARP